MTRSMLAMLALAAAMFAVAPWMIDAAPYEATMGLVYKIYFFHMPSAWMFLTAAVVAGVASFRVLFLKRPRAEYWVTAAAELAVLFGAFTLVTGPLWARKAWGTWWTGEPRLMLTMVAALIFYAYVVVRSIGGRTEITRRICAALAILGVADIPLVHFAVQKWRGNHPRVLRNGGISDEMEVALTAAMLAVFSLFATLVLLRIRVGMAEEKVERLHRLATARGNDIEDRRRSPLLENP